MCTGSLMVKNKWMSLDACSFKHATEIPIQRSKKQKKSYSGKKKKYTFKVQAIIHYKTQRILSLCADRGSVHDFELFKRNFNQNPIGGFYPRR
ncbi:transposase family protein [Acinetobacter sp. YH12029]|uniref:transposase family protein n=1 Tax=unclassified Acinetobacter TaxID=196816 RepID=UPI00359FF755